MKKSVGLVVLTVQGGMLRVCCQIRAGWNNEKKAPESYPGCLQVTCHGKLEEGEDFYEGLIRESNEELGVAFTAACQADIELVEVGNVRNEKSWVITYAAQIPSDRLALIKKENGVGFLILRAEDVSDIVPITPDMKEHGAPDGKMAMFQDEIDAIKSAFAKIGNCIVK